MRTLAAYLIMGPCFAVFQLILWMGSPLIMFFAWLEGSKRPVSQAFEELSGLGKEWNALIADARKADRASE